MVQLHPQFLPQEGKTEFVVLPYAEFLALQELLEDLEDWEDLQAAKAEDKGEPSLSLEEVKRELDLL
ncbi:MAG: type II toxin-antitoxin system Phd/YefM family antitoxin [Spirulina sp. SIO3F2]|nr:type II toxin-antitoxin system Phd/YefM family antitoxin [Spirulina sp. SIO3F2]